MCVFKNTGALDLVDQASLVNLEIVEDKNRVSRVVKAVCSGRDVFGEVLIGKCDKVRYPVSQEALAVIEELLEKMQKSDAPDMAAGSVTFRLPRV